MITCPTLNSIEKFSIIVNDKTRENTPYFQHFLYRITQRAESALDKYSFKATKTDTLVFYHIWKEIARGQKKNLRHRPQDSLGQNDQLQN